MIIVIDLETGGFSNKNDAVCEIAFLVADYNHNVLKESSLLVEPYGKDYGDKAMEINGYTESQLQVQGFKPEFARDVLLDYLEKSEVIVGQNIKRFDLPFLKEFLNEFNSDIFVDEYDVFDTQEESRKQGHKKNSLKDLCEHYGIENENPHKGLSDVRATFELYKILENDKSLF